MTTTFQTVLQSGDYTKLRAANGNNDWWARQFITLCKNTVVFKALAANTIAVSSFAQIPYNTVTVGAYTDIEIGETFFLSHTSDIRDAYYRGRIRKVATSGLTNVNETSVNILIGDFIFVVYDFDVWDVLSRMVNGVQFWDWDIAFHPLAPAIIGLRNAYIQYDPDGSTYRVAFDVSNSFSADQASTSSLTYQFTFKAGTYTVISGALNTAVVTVDFNTDTENWGKLEVTDSQGTTKTRRFYIRNHGVNDPPSLDFSGTQITGSIENGWNASVSAWNGVSSVLNQTYTVISTQEYYNGVLGPVSIANNIDMVGRFHRETNTGRGDPTYSYISDVKFDIEGICTQMQRLQEQDLTTIYKTTATVVDEISLDTPQRSILYYCDTHSTVSNLCDIAFPVGFDITYLMQYVPNQGGNVLDAIRGIAAQMNASVEFAPDGRIQVVRDTRYLVNKSGVVVVGDFTTADFTTVDLPVDPINKVGRADGYGISFNAANIAAFRSRAPGNAQSYAAGQATLDNQILLATSHATLAQAELNYRLGQFLNIENLTYAQDWKATTGGYHFLIPSRGQRVTHTLPATTNARGLAFTNEDYWQVVSVSINHNNADGSRDVQTHEELEPPVGDAGDTVPQIAGGTQTNPILLQPLDPFPALPDDPGNYLPDDPTPNPYPSNVPSKTGNLVILTDGTIVDISNNVINNPTPPWTDITDSDASAVEDVSFDLTTIAPPIGAYELDNDGTDSIIRYAADAGATPVVWQDGTPFSGIFKAVRSANTPGRVLAYAPAPGAGSGTINITYPVGSGPASANVGDTITITSGVGGGDQHVEATFDECVELTVVGYSNYAPFISPGNSVWAYNDCDGNTHSGPEAQPGDTPLSFPANTCGGDIQFSGDPGSVFTVNVKLGLLCDPGGNALVVLSTDYGATTNSPVTVGASPGINGAFDLLRIGGTSIAAANGQVKIATTLGGAYSNASGGTLSAGDPVALVLPFRRLDHGARQDNATDPDYLLGGSVAISNASLWKVNGVTGTKTDITPVSGATVAPHCLTCWQSSSILKLAVVIFTSGLYKLYTKVGAGAWTFRRNVGNPVFLRCRRNDLYGTQLYLIDGNTLYVSTDWGINWRTRTLPSSNAGVAMDIYW